MVSEQSNDDTVAAAHHGCTGHSRMLLCAWDVPDYDRTARLPILWIWLIHIWLYQVAQTAASHELLFMDKASLRKESNEL